jgi:hypothetical protein
MAVMFRALLCPDVRLTRFETSIPATLRPSFAVGGEASKSSVLFSHLEKSAEEGI